jgi:hypothetical protein
MLKKIDNDLMYLTYYDGTKYCTLNNKPLTTEYQFYNIQINTCDINKFGISTSLDNSKIHINKLIFKNDNKIIYELDISNFEYQLFIANLRRCYFNTNFVLNINNIKKFQGYGWGYLNCLNFVDNHKIIFCHIFKNAGTFMKTHLKTYNISSNKSKVTEFIFNITPLELSKYFIFGLSRNPFDRAKSLYYYLTDFHSAPTLTEFLKLLSPEFDKKNAHSCPQINFIISHTMRFYKMENLKLLSSILVEKYNININLENKINKSNDVNLEDILTSEGKTLIQNYYREDFEYFNYEMDIN